MGLVSPGGVHSHQDHARGAGAASCTRPASRPWCTPSPTAATRRRNPPREDLAPAAAPRCPTACRSAPSSAATSRWTATSAGTASSQAYDAHGRRPRARAAPTPAAAIEAAYAAGKFDEFVPASVIGDYTGMKDGDAHPVLQLPRRPGARNPRRPARSEVRRLRPRARCRSSPPPSA